MQGHPNTIWIDPESHRANTLGDLITIQYVGAIKKSAQRNGLQFYQTRSRANTLSDTLPTICIDKVVCKTTREEFYYRIYKSPRVPRVTLMPNSKHVQNDVLVSESRKPDDREIEVHQHRENCGSDRCVDFLIPGIPYSVVEQVETKRREKVRR